MSDLFGDSPVEYDDDFEGDDDIGYDSPLDSADTIARFQSPRLMDFCEGFSDIESALLKQFKSGRMHHGLIFSGPKGIGKATFAYRLTRFLLKYGNVDPNETDMFGDAPVIPDSLDIPSDDRIFSQVASGGHADLLTIERAYDEGTGKTAAGVAVADIRKVAPFLHMTSSNGGWRIVIIDDADTMNRSAQNALLKILEEPPKKTLLILVTHRLGALIPTIRSRTQLINMHPPSREGFNALIKKYDPHLDPVNIDTLYALSKGSIGASLSIIEEGGLDTLSDLLLHLRQAPDWDWEAIHKFADQFGRAAKVEHYKNFTALMVWIYTELTTAKARGLDIRVNALNINALQNTLKHSSLEKLLETWQNLKDLFTQVERANLDKKQAVLRAFSILAT